MLAGRVATSTDPSNFDKKRWQHRNYLLSLFLCPK
ncbi:hypothetical protein FMEAI12_3280018 [Parafrankia sp. Ea1.12]|nr:hypothetical protein FMEAI12_3280018 [Parafrankia sp. Ea1.12]